MGFREMRGGDGVSDVEIRRNEIIELLYTVVAKDLYARFFDWEAEKESRGTKYVYDRRCA